MVVMQRSEVGWYRAISFWALISSTCMLALMVWSKLGPDNNGGGSSSTSTLGAVALGLLTLAFIAVSLVGLWRFRNRSRAILYKQGDEYFLFTNKSAEEAYKYQFLRDVVGEKVINRYQAEKPPSLPVGLKGFDLRLVFQGANEPLIVRYCKMLFDDVYLNDPDLVWVHYDSGNNFNPENWDKKTPDDQPAAQPAAAAQSAAG